MFEVTLIPVLVAGIVPVILGMIWYSPKVFGTVWMRLEGLSPDMTEVDKKKMPLHVSLAFVSTLIMAYVLAHFGIAWGVFDWISAVELAFWVWLGFQVPILMNPALWQKKSWKLVGLNASYQLITMILVAVALVLVG